MTNTVFLCLAVQMKYIQKDKPQKAVVGYHGGQIVYRVIRGPEATAGSIPIRRKNMGISVPDIEDTAIADIIAKQRQAETAKVKNGVLPMTTR